MALGMEAGKKHVALKIRLWLETRGCASDVLKH